jgi:archaellum component FlaC
MKKAEVTNDEIMAMLSKFADRVDERFDGVDERFDKVEADVAELKADVAGLKTDVADLKTDVTELKTDVDRIYGILDAHMSRIEQIMQENAVQTHQYDRMQRWIFQLADQANVRLKYE